MTEQKEINKGNETNNDRKNAKLLLCMLKRIVAEMEMFWRASIMARGGRVDDSRWAGLQREMDNARRIIMNVERDMKEQDNEKA